MFYRRAGIFHTNYRADRSLFPIPFERNAMLVVFAIALAAPWIFSSLALTSYIRPWLIWTSAVLGLNLILGWAGQFHFGYAAIMAIGAYASVHATRHGVPSGCGPRTMRSPARFTSADSTPASRSMS